METAYRHTEHGTLRSARGLCRLTVQCRRGCWSSRRLVPGLHKQVANRGRTKARLADTYLKSSELTPGPETHLHAAGVGNDDEDAGGTDVLDSGDCGSEVSLV